MKRNEGTEHSGGCLKRNYSRSEEKSELEENNN